MASKTEKYFISSGSIRHLLRNAYSAFPREASGLLLERKMGERTILHACPTQNNENTLVSFRIKDKEIRLIEESLYKTDHKICGCFHSHILGAARPSKNDCAGAKTPGELWLIYSLRHCQLKLFQWDGNRFQRMQFRVF